MEFFEKTVVSALDEGVSSISDLIDAADGAFILEIYNVLKKIVTESCDSDNNKDISIAKKILKEFTNKFNTVEYKKQTERINYLPIPHILDSDWRFTSQTTKYLGEYVKKLLKPQSNLILIGVPSLFLLLNENKTLIDSATLLIERNNIARNFTGNPNIICGDVRNVRLYNCSDAILCDPPWYIEATKYFLDSAQAMLKKDGVLLMIVPPKGVRPSVEEEYKQLIEYAAERKLNFSKILNNSLNYVTPPFEINTLKNEGITSFPLDWRKGSIMIFTKEQDTALSSELPTENKQTEWLDSEIQNIRFKVRDYVDPDQKKPIDHLCKNDIYPTVSMRLELKNNVNIWTSGNRVYRCKTPVLFRMTLAMVHTHGFSRSKIYSVLNETEETKAYLDLIEKIVKIEEKEYGRFWSKK